MHVLHSIDVKNVEPMCISDKDRCDLEACNLWIDRRLEKWSPKARTLQLVFMLYSHKYYSKGYAGNQYANTLFGVHDSDNGAHALASF